MTTPDIFTRHKVPPARVRLRSRAAVVVATVFAPSPQLSLSQWADANRHLTADMGAVEPGPWRTDRIPYLRGVMDALSEPTRPRVCFMKSSQVGGSEIGHNWILMTIDQEPQPFLMLLPTDGVLKNWSKTKLDPMLASTPCLKGKLVDGSGRRDSGDTMARKVFPGGYLAVLAARSSAQLRLLVSARAMADEIDEFPVDVNKQGDPLALLERALRTFWDAGAKLYLVSTPTLAGFSRIADEYERSDQQRFHVPCPECGHFQTLRWRDPDRDSSAFREGQNPGLYRLVCERDDEGELIPRSARYQCEACEYLIEERFKEGMLAVGEWRATYPDRATAGFHINTLYSPLVAWSRIVEEFMASRKTASALKTFDNLWLGVPFEEKGLKLEPHLLAARADTYAAQVPAEVGILTGFVDVQGDRLETLTVGWGAWEESWVIEWDSFEGDPGQADLWLHLEREWLNREWQHQSGAKLRLAAVGIDANYQTEAVHNFCDRHDRRRVIPTIGKSGRTGPLLVSPERLKFKRTRANRRPTYTIHVDAGKDRLASRLQRAEPGPEFIHFPADLDTVFYEQLTSEKLITVYVNKRPVRKWTLLPNRRNEGLDLMVGNLAALTHLGSAVTQRLAEIVQEVQKAGSESRGGTSSVPPKTPVSGRRMRSRGVE